MRLISKKYKQHKGKVYDIGVDTKDHSYSVNGAVVHNSSAGSLVSYLLGIVNLDPLKFNLLFERFLNDGRMGTMEECDLYNIKTDKGDIELVEGSMLRVEREGKEVVVYVEELNENDRILIY